MFLLVTAKVSGVRQFSSNTHTCSGDLGSGVCPLEASVSPSEERDNPCCCSYVVGMPKSREVCVDSVGPCWPTTSSTRVSGFLNKKQSHSC